MFTEKLFLRINLPNVKQTHTKNYCERKHSKKEKRKKMRIKVYINMRINSCVNLHIITIPRNI